MTVLQTERLTKTFGIDVLFEPFSAQVARGDRIALIGDNGVGKSTLLHLLAGIEAPTDGAVRPIGSVRVALLPQHARLEGEGSLWEAMAAPFAELRAVETRLREMEETMASADAAGLHEYDELLHRFEREGGYRIDASIRAALAGVGLGEEAYDQPVATLSGGEEARAALARTLLEAPDLLLLDEPTNHLDFAGLDWLEDRLLNFDGALVLVSHDRHLLERVTNRTWEVAFERVSVYRVGYAHSRELREAERERQLIAYEKQEETLARYKEFVRRNKAGQKVSQAKDREKKIERIEAARVERPRDARRISLRIQTGNPSGKRVLSTHGLAVGFDAPLFDCPDVDLRRGEKVAIVGPNGCGKTTLLRTIAGEHPPLRGSIELGHNVQLATYSQTQEGLHGGSTVLETILARTSLTIGEARGLLGRFLFSGDDVAKRMSALSGGERSRVALALLSLVEGNLLLFDEPTNHLDLASQEILERALRAYDGTILLVSHDRALLEAVTTQTWSVVAGEMQILPHGYAEYRRRSSSHTSESPAPRAPRNPSRRAEPRASGRNRYVRARTHEERAEIEGAIETLESQIERIEAALLEASEASDAERIASLAAEHKAAKSELDERYRAWERLATEPESEEA